MSSNGPTGALRRILILASGLSLAMALAHLTGVKVPVLFVYPDVPSHAYQDKLIGLGLIGFAGLGLAALRDRGAVPILAGALWLAVAGLVHVNLSDALAAVAGRGAGTLPWLSTAGFAALAAAITGLHLGAAR